MGNATSRTVERFLAANGKINEVLSKFKIVNDVSYGGVLLALPALLANGLLRHTKKYFCLPDGYYSITHIFITLAFVFLLRIKSIDSIKECHPGELGKLLGLDRIPEVKTIREKIEILSQQEGSIEWSAQLSQDWMNDHPDLAGILYVDGHVRVYSGKNANLPRKYVSRERLCLKGITDYWVNDALGQPFFYISKAVTSGLLSVLREDIVPRLEREVPSQPSAEELEKNPYLSRFSIVFDREGYSPEFIKEMWGKRISCYTYHKYPAELWDEQEFREIETRLYNGENVTMKLAERGSWLGDKLWVREIRKLSESGHQTSIITTDYTSHSNQIAPNMFARWSQENFFRYMMQHYGIDRLIEYETTSIDDTIKIVNPTYRQLESEIKSKNGKLSREKVKFANITLEIPELDQEKEKRKIHKYIQKKSELQETIHHLKNQIAELKEKRKGTKKHILLGQLPEDERYTTVSNDKKHILDTIKMICYRAETAMANTISVVMSSPEEARAKIRQILNTEVNLKPDKKNNILYVYLHHLNNQQTDRIAAHLCGRLNETETIFPGTEMRIIYKLVS